jgi:pimeloyl-ACP methyl ester carboxylesterase
MMRFVLPGFAVFSLSHCAYVRNPEVPMAKLRYTDLGPHKARGALVLLPGFGDRLETFSDRGFIAALRRHAPQYDVIAADAHFGYYRKRSLVQRLEHDLIGPLLREGYRELWLVGTSMGGFGAVAYAREHPARVTGLLLFAPYMGPDGVIEEVKRVGLCKYRAPPLSGKIEDQESFARANFGYLGEKACKTRDVALWLAVGEDDRLFGANRTLGAALAPERFLVMKGGHGWKVWTPAADELAARAWGAVSAQP